MEVSSIYHFSLFMGHKWIRMIIYNASFFTRYFYLFAVFDLATFRSFSCRWPDIPSQSGAPLQYYRIYLSSNQSIIIVRRAFILANAISFWCESFTKSLTLLYLSISRCCSSSLVLSTLNRVRCLLKEIKG